MSWALALGRGCGLSGGDVVDMGSLVIIVSEEFGGSDPDTLDSSRLIFSHLLFFFSFLLLVFFFSSLLLRFSFLFFFSMSVFIFLFFSLYCSFLFFLFFHQFFNSKNGVLFLFVS